MTPGEGGKSPYERVAEQRRRERWRDWLIFILCAIIAVFIGLARRTPVEQVAGASPRTERAAPR